MKIYLAARFHWKNRLREFRKDLEELGHIVTSSWLDTPWEDDGSSKWMTTAAPPDAREEWAIKDITDIEMSHVFIYFSEGTPARGGCHVEFGYALAMYVNVQLEGVWIVGPQENVFHYHPSVKQFDDWDAMLNFLRKLEE